MLAGRSARPVATVAWGALLPPSPAAPLARPPRSCVSAEQQARGRGQCERGPAAQHREPGPRREREEAAHWRVGGLDLVVLRYGLLDGEGGGRGDP
jgi:hypothetical protein